MKDRLSDDEAFTGLEAAIVLIAFVVVAAVFSYVVLGAGFFTTQKSQETVHNAVGQASSAVEVVGNVYGINSSTGTSSKQVDIIKFSIGLAAGGAPIDITKTVLTLSTRDHVQTLEYVPGSSDPLHPNNPRVTVADSNVDTPLPGSINCGQWGVKDTQNDLGEPNGILDPGEEFTIIARPSIPLNAYDAFDLEIKPSVGTSLDIHRTINPTVDTVNILY